MWGIIFALATAISVTPALVEFLPDEMEPTIRGIAGLIVAASGVGLAVSVKDKNVTGGTTAQTADGSVAQAPTEAVLETEAAKPK